MHCEVLAEARIVELGLEREGRFWYLRVYGACNAFIGDEIHLIIPIVSSFDSRCSLMLV